MNLKNPNKKKVRGVKHKCSSMIKSINEFTENFPQMNLNKGYYHSHIPVAQEFIDLSKTPQFVRKICIQTLLSRVKHLIDIKPKLDIKTRVVTCIQLPDLWNSQIIIFYGENYFNSFFERNSEYQKWILLPSNRDVLSKLGIAIPTGLSSRGYREEIIDNDCEYISEIWFIGEL
ncbi:MAG: DUF3916 domain-containing protein [Bacillota bacterium]|nr:DUF3916 domain-containing protein [Bacillota bacterium]